jgi:hypothetical protein
VGGSVAKGIASATGEQDRFLCATTRQKLVTRRRNLHISRPLLRPSTLGRKSSLAPAATVGESRRLLLAKLIAFTKGPYRRDFDAQAIDPAVSL